MIKQITFHTQSGGPQTINVQDYDDNDSPEFYGSPFDEAISGKLRQRLRGLRKNVRVSYRACVEQSTFRTLFNNIANDLFVEGLSSIRYSEGDSLTDTHELVPTDRMRHKMEYAAQHGLFMPVMEFVGGRIGTISIEFADWGLVTSSVTESEDWGLITQSVTESEDYELI